MNATVVDAEFETLINKFLFFKEASTFIKIKLEDITFLQSDHVYIIVNSLYKKLTVRTTMRNMLHTLQQPIFFQIHRSYCININYIDSISQNHVMVNGTTLPINKRYRKLLLEMLELQ